MFTTRKIIIGILAFLTSFILLYSSYMYSNMNKDFEIPSLQNRSTGEYFFDVQGKDVQETTNGQVRLLQLDSFSNIFTSNKTMQASENSIDIQETGVYMINILSATTGYRISGVGFTFEIDKPANIIIVRSEEETLILTLNTDLKVQLHDVKNLNVVNNVHLYPHEFFAFKPKQNQYIKAADVSKIQLNTTIDYIAERLSNRNMVNEAFIKKVPRISDEQRAMLHNIVQTYLQEQKNKYEMIDRFLHQRFASLPGEELMKQYFFLFVNDEKQKVYYQNRAFETFHTILTKEPYKQLQKDLLTQLLLVHNFSPTEHKKLSKILQEKLINYIATISDYKKKKDMYEMYYVLEKQDIILQDINPDTLHKNTVDYYDRIVKQMEVGLQTTDQEMMFYSAFTEYDIYNSQNIYSILEKYSKNLVQNTKDRKSIGYVVYFLNKVLINSFQQLNSGATKEIENILSIFNTYVGISTNYYSANDIKTKEIQRKMRETGIKEYGKLIEKLGDSLKKTYFSEGTASDGEERLFRNETKGLSIQRINIFEINLKKIYSFFQKYSGSMRSSPIAIVNRKKFQKSQKDFTNYLSALKDYDKYVRENDKKSSVFINTQNTNQEKDLDITYAKDLLSQFNAVNIQRARITSKNRSYCSEPEKNINEGSPYCYEIDNIQIKNRFFSFLLIPSEGNKITNVYLIDGNRTKKELESYGEIKLDDIKKRYENNNETESLYNEFLSSTFSKLKEKGNLTANEDTQNTKDNIDISSIFADTNTQNDYHKEELLRTVKNTLLLGKSGTFNLVKDFLNVEYKDISIKESKNISSRAEQYDIYLSNVDLNYSNSALNLSGILSSKYTFTAGGISSFNNPKIQVTNGDYNYRYDMIGIIPIKKLKPHIQTIAQIDMEIIDAIKLADKYIEANGNLNIKYYINNKIFQVNYGDLSFNFNANTRLIKTLNYKGKKYLTKLIKFDNLEAYFSELP